MGKVPGALSPVVAVDRTARAPLHKQIYDGFRTAIVGRNLRTGQQLPSSRALAGELGISRIPVLNAYAQLIAEGYFETRAGAGTFVSGSLPEQLTSCVNRNGRAPESRTGPRPVSRNAAGLAGRESEPWLIGLGPGPFSVGQLSFDHFPFQVWSNLVSRHCRGVRASALNYSDPLGAKDLREAISTYVATARAVRCDPRQIMIVSGSQQALDISARVLLDPGSRVWIEEPGYTLMRSALTLAGCQLAPVPVDAEGLDVAAGIRKCPRARAAYVTPSHQFPLGVTMSASRRLQLLEWARSSGAWIFEDDYDSEYRYESMPIASLQGLDGDATVIYIGTFSKTLFPSLRLGYIVMPPALVERFVTVRRAMDICPPHLHQAVLADFISQGHFARHIRKTRLLYSERRSALVQAIRSTFGSAIEVLGGEAGMHLVVTLPDGVDDREMAAQAVHENLRLWPLSATYLTNPARHGFILGFASTPAAEMPEAVERLAKLLGKVLEVR